MAENFFKTMGEGWKAMTGGTINGTTIGVIQGAENNAGRLMEFNGQTLDKRIYDIRQRFEKMKTPSQVLDKRIAKEELVKKNVQQMFLQKKAKYLMEPYLRSSAEAERLAAKAVFHFFESEMKDLDEEYGNVSLAEDVYKQRTDDKDGGLSKVQRKEIEDKFKEDPGIEL